MRIRKRQLLWLNLFVIAMMASAQAQRTPEQVAQQDIPVEIIKIDTNLVVLRIAVSDQQGRAATNLRQEAFKVFDNASRLKFRELIGRAFASFVKISYRSSIASPRFTSPTNTV